MKTFDLYGSLHEEEISVLKDIVEQSLHIKMQMHESSYRCGTYYRTGMDGEEHFILQKNYDGVENEWAEDHYREYPFVLYVNETLRADAVQHELEATGKFKLLRRETF